MIIIKVHLNRTLIKFVSPVSYDYNERTNVLTIVGSENKTTEVARFVFNIANSSYFVVYGEEQSEGIVKVEKDNKQDDNTNVELTDTSKTKEVVDKKVTTKTKEAKPTSTSFVKPKGK